VLNSDMYLQQHSDSEMCTGQHSDTEMYSEAFTDANHGPLSLGSVRALETFEPPEDFVVSRGTYCGPKVRVIICLSTLCRYSSQYCIPFPSATCIGGCCFMGLCTQEVHHGHRLVCSDKAYQAMKIHLLNAKRRFLFVWLAFR